MAALVSDVDLDERLHQSRLSDVLAEETSSSTTPPAKKIIQCLVLYYRHLRKLTAIGNTHET